LASLLDLSAAFRLNSCRVTRLLPDWLGPVAGGQVMVKGLAVADDLDGGREA